jgi:hypothetical protein
MQYYDTGNNNATVDATDDHGYRKKFQRSENGIDIIGEHLEEKIQRTQQEIIFIQNDIGCRKFRDDTEYGCSEKKHERYKDNANDNINAHEKIKKRSGYYRSFILSDPHGFRNEHSRINDIDEAREQDHGAVNKKIDIRFNITAKELCNENGE